MCQEQENIGSQAMLVRGKIQNKNIEIRQNPVYEKRGPIGMQRL
jgi:hypothetical protein